MMPTPRHMLHEERADTAAEQSYGWLDVQIIALRAFIDALDCAYKLSGPPHHIEEAIRKLEDAADDLERQLSELDEGGE